MIFFFFFFDVVIDKPSNQESPRSSEIKNCPVIEVKQTVQHSDEQVNTRKEIQTAQTEKYQQRRQQHCTGKQ